MACLTCKTWALKKEGQQVIWAWPATQRIKKGLPIIVSIKWQLERGMIKIQNKFSVIGYIGLLDAARCCYQVSLGDRRHQIYRRPYNGYLVQKDVAEIRHEHVHNVQRQYFGGNDWRYLKTQFATLWNLLCLSHFPRLFTVTFATPELHRLLRYRKILAVLIDFVSCLRFGCKNSTCHSPVKFKRSVRDLLRWSVSIWSIRKFYYRCLKTVRSSLSAQSIVPWCSR